MHCSGSRPQLWLRFFHSCLQVAARGGNSTSSTPVAANPGPSQAVVELFVSPTGLQVNVTIRESGGVGIAINWLRITLEGSNPGIANGETIQQTNEYGVSYFVNEFGSNRVGPMSQIQFSVSQWVSGPCSEGRCSTGARVVLAELWTCFASVDT